MVDPRSRTSADWQRQEALIRGFEEAWRRGDVPALEAYLPVDAPGPVLLELVHADLECRFKAGTPARLESYLERFPQLGADPAALAGLVRAEYDLRRRTEPALELREYLPRFPQCAAELNQDVPTCASPAAELPQLPGYEVTRFLARGGMGAVYEARQPRLERRVAVKIMAAEAAQQPAFTDRFVREARALARLNHPHIVAVHDFGEAHGHYYLAMEFVEGATCVSVSALGSSKSLPPWRSPVRSARPSNTPTRKGWCTGTSSRRTFCSIAAAGPRWPTSAWPSSCPDREAGR